jgi:Bacterial archaeo-eukaryotic release factor family 7
VDVVRRTDLQRLALPRHGPCVSVFLPTHRAGREVEQVPIRLKNLLRQATDVLKTDGVRAPEIDRLLAPLRGLLDDRLFWQYQSDGLALFSRPGWWRSFRVPLHLPELAVVADRFHISPLLPLLTGDGHFFVLTLSQNQIRLLEGTRDRLEEVDLPGVPLGVRDALQGEEAQRQLQLYVADRGGVAARGIFHGHGSELDRHDQTCQCHGRCASSLRLSRVVVRTKAACRRSSIPTSAGTGWSGDAGSELGRPVSCSRRSRPRASGTISAPNATPSSHQGKWSWRRRPMTIPAAMPVASQATMKTVRTSVRNLINSLPLRRHEGQRRTLGPSHGQRRSPHWMLSEHQMSWCPSVVWLLGPIPC